MVEWRVLVGPELIEVWNVTERFVVGRIADLCNINLGVAEIVVELWDKVRENERIAMNSGFDEQGISRDLFNQSLKALAPDMKQNADDLVLFLDFHYQLKKRIQSFQPHT